MEIMKKYRQQGFKLMKKTDSLFIHFLLIISLFLSSCAMPIRTRVIDAVTSQPIEGAVVMAEWTKNRGPWDLVWTSEAMSLTEARRFENYLKRQKGGNGFYQATGLSRKSGS